MKVVVLNGSVRQGQTDRALALFEAKLKAVAPVEVVRINLRERRLESCRGCTVCLNSGEEKCPCHDDRDAILAEMDSADGVVFASPNYALQVTWLFKNFLDRLAFVFHRPRFFRKASLSFVVEGVYGAKKITAYLDEVASFWGFNVSPGVRLTIPWSVYAPAKPWPADGERQVEAKLDRAAQRFHNDLMRRDRVVPSWKHYLVFRAARTAHRNTPEKERSRDYAHFERQGWFTSKFFCDAKISLIKRTSGALVESLLERKMKHDAQKRP